MSDFKNYFRSFGRNINGAFHKGVGRAYKPPGNPQHNFAWDPSSYKEVFGQASRISRTEKRHVDVNQDAYNVPVASRVYSASPEVTVPVSPADAEPRVNTEPYIYRAQDDTTMESAPQSREVTPEPELHHLVDVITAQSGPQPRLVTRVPVLELHHLEDATNAQSTPRVRVDTPQQSLNRLRGSNIDRDTPLPARIVRNPEPRATVSRLPTAVRSASLQERFGTPGHSNLPRVTVLPNQSEYRSSASDAVESYSVQPRVVSDPQPTSRSSIPVFVGTASSQQKAVTARQTTSQSSIPVATRPTSSQQRVSGADQPPPLRQAFTTSARFPLMNGQEPVLSEQVASTRQRHCHNVVPQEFRIPVRSTPGVYGTAQESSLLGDLNALRLHHSSDRADRPSFAARMQATSRQAAQSNGTSLNTVAGNTSSSGLQNTHTNGADRSATSHGHEHNSGACSNTRPRRELAHAESIESLNIEMNSPITEPVINFPRPRHPEPSLSNFSPYQINNEYLAEAYMRQTRGLTLAQRLEAERPRRGLPRSPGMYNLPTVNDEINHPIHPGDFHDDGYHPIDRDPDRRAERAPAPANSPADGHLRQHHGSRGSRQRRADRHRAALAREEALTKEKESKKRKRERERREKCISKVLNQISMNECFCEDAYDDVGEPHEPVKMPNCRHIFGRSCITEWLMSHNTCPLCRNQVALSP
ncbi:hypothetical protein OCU04_010364 [Sclerotinia nivalis]|uniref:RING-type domain-containing protein n=1 Tax=Sclerotinia nivalis TaxID=352851 RepID=A0A9X0AEK8_9HELO|nr:hypothetical protein OCU04_010364 [Sclerotinia nivalis]